jgi:putative peptidoglycan lipid II flippase
VWDAFTVAFRIPNLFRRLFGEGALSAAFIPVFTDYLENRTKKEAWQLVNVVATMLVITLGGILIIGEIAFLVIPKVTTLPAKWELIFHLLKIMFPYVLLICLVALAMAVLNTFKHFFMPALSPVALNICIIVGIIVFVPLIEGGLDRKVFAVAIAVFVAGFIQLGMQIPALKRKQNNYFNGQRVKLFKPQIDFSHPGLIRILKLIGPVIFGLAVVQLNLLVNSLIAVGFSQSPDGPAQFTFAGMSVAYPLKSGAASVLYYGDRLIEFPLGIFGIAMATAVFPTLSAHAVRKEWANFSDAFSNALRMVFFIGIPASVGLILLREPLVQLLFERRAFAAESSQRTASVVLFYAIGVWAYCGLHVLIRTFHSLQDTITPVKIGAAMVCLNIILNLTLIWYIQEGGLALSTSICAIVQIVILFAILRRRIRITKGKEIVVSFLKASLATAFMALACWLTLKMFSPDGASTLLKALRVFIPIIASLTVFAGVSYLLKADELRQFARALVNRPKSQP